MPTGLKTRCQNDVNAGLKPGVKMVWLLDLKPGVKMVSLLDLKPGVKMVWQLDLKPEPAKAQDKYILWVHYICKQQNNFHL